MRFFRFALLALVVPVLPAGADVVYLRGGGQITGVVASRTADRLVLEVGPGLVTLPMSRVARIEAGPSALGEYRERASRLAPTDVRSWVELALWARANGLETQARETFERVLRLDPGNAAANEALGNILVGGQWMTAEDGYRARGLVPFEGRWIAPSERDAVLRERAEADAAEAARRQAEGARREAEARAREAEARARAAEADALMAEAMARDPWSGVGWGGWVAGGFVNGFVGGGVTCGGLSNPCTPPPPVVVVKPHPRPHGRPSPPRDGGSSGTPAVSRGGAVRSVISDSRR